MSDIKIKAESFPIRCDICHQSDRFHPQKGYCSRCSVVNLTLELQTYAKAGKIARPPEVTIENRGDALKLINPYFFWGDILISAIAILLGVLLIGIGWIIIGFLLALIFVYLLLANLISRREVTINKKELKIWEGPIPIGENKTVRIDDVERLYCSQSKLFGFSLDYSYKVMAKMRNGAEVELLVLLTSEEAASYIEQQIAAHAEIVKKN